MKRSGIFLYACWLLCSCGEACSQSDDVVVQALPGEKIFPAFHADALNHQISLARITDNREWSGTIGGAIPLIEVRTSGATFQGGVGVSTYNRLIKTPGHITVYTVDYKVDFPLDIRLSALALRFALGHMSCHFADDGIEQLHRTSINSVKDYVTFASSYDLPAVGGNTYLAVHYVFHILPYPDKKWQLQAGLECLNRPLAPWAVLYGALDVKLKEEVGWGSTQSYQVGVKLFQKKNYGLRFSYTLRTGLDERGQFFDQRVTENLLMMAIDF
jgi:hypothetical protein